MRAVYANQPIVRQRNCGFTIIEMMVATAVFMLMVVLLVSVVSQVNSLWQQTDGQKNRRQSSRALLDLISRDLQGALCPVDGNSSSKIRFNLNPVGLNDSGVGNFKSALFWTTVNPGSRRVSDIVDVGYFIRRTSSGSVLCRIERRDDGQPNPPDIWTLAGSLAPADEANDYRGLAADGVLAMYVTLYKKSGQVESLPNETYSGTALPYSVEIALVIADSRTTQRLVSAGKLTAADDLADTPEAFVTALGESYRAGVQVYRTRVDIPQAR